jgi:hypothetical protein
MLQLLKRFRRTVSVVAMLAIFAAGMLSASMPLHAAPVPVPASTPCHHEASNHDAPLAAPGAFDFCKKRCLAASPDHVLGHAVTSHRAATKIVAVFPLYAPFIPAAPLVDVRVSLRSDFKRPRCALPLYLRDLRLLI